MKYKRNGKIDFLRFIFCLFVIIFHSDIFYEIDLNFFELTFFSDGRIAVEFFFIVSGYYLASFAEKLPVHDHNNIGRTTILFTAKKALQILPYHLFIFPVSWVIYLFLYGYHKNISDITNWFVSTLPNFLLIFKSGLPENTVIGDEWYIAKMLLAGMILLPLVLKFRKTFTRIVCPVLALLMIGYVIYSTSMLGGVDEWVYGDIIPKSSVRAFAEMALGIFVYEIVSYMKKCNFTKTSSRLCLTIIELISYICCIFFLMDNSVYFEGYFVLFIFFALIVSFSGLSYGSQFFNRPIFYKLGKLSLPLYLCQRLVFRVFNNIPIINDIKLPFIKLGIYFAAILLVALLSMIFAPLIEKKLKKVLNRILPESDYRFIYK